MLDLRAGRSICLKSYYMKYSILILLLTVFVNVALSQNVGIGTTQPHNSALLDISGNSGGLLIPRLSIAERNAITTPAKGLIVFLTTDSSLYYFDGSWQKLVPQSQAWNLTGNELPNDSSFFLGTTNAFALRIKVNNQFAGIIDSSSKNHSWGYKALLSNTSGMHNSAFGNAALSKNTVGYENVAIGNSSLISNTDGFANVALGFLSLPSNRIGYSNTAVGHQALYGNQTGSNNVAIGGSSSYNAFSGSFNTALGFTSLSNNVMGNLITGIGYNTQATALINNSTAIGANASVDESNKIVLGDPNVTKVQTVATIIAKGFASGLTTTEISALVTPIEGTIIYNKTTRKPVYFNGTVWKYFDETNM